jgi:hypothetical protein
LASFSLLFIGEESIGWSLLCGLASVAPVPLVRPWYSIGSLVVTEIPMLGGVSISFAIPFQGFLPLGGVGWW